MSIFKVRPHVDTARAREVARVFEDVLNSYEDEWREAAMDLILFGPQEAERLLLAKIEKRHSPH